MTGAAKHHWWRNKSVLAAAAVAILLALTWAAEQMHVRSMQQRAPEVLQRVSTRAEARLTALFDEMQTSMLRTAENIASAPGVAEAVSSGDHAGTLVRRIAQQPLPARWSVSVHGRHGELLAWNGVTIPSTTEAIPDSGQVWWGLAADGDWKRALELWVPVPNAPGHVRLLQLLYERTPVQNEYLQEYRISEQWSRVLGLSVTTSFDVRQGRGAAHPLAAQDGSVVGDYSLEQPSIEQLAVDLKRRYRDMLAFGVLLLLDLGLWKLWKGFHSRQDFKSLGTFLLAWWVARCILLWISAPGRWQTGKAPLSPLFDATHLGSKFGGQLMQSTGDLLVTAVFLLVTALLWLQVVHRRYGVPSNADLIWMHFSRSPRRIWRMLIATVVGLGLVWMLTTAVHHAVLDSTVDFLGRDTLLPTPLNFVIFSALGIAVLAVVLAIAAILRIAMGAAPENQELASRAAIWHLVGAGLVMGALIVVLSVRQIVPWADSLTFWTAGIAAVFLQVGAGLRWLTLRSVLLGALIVSALLYPLLDSGFSERRQTRMGHAAASFDRGYDSGVAFGVRDLLEEVRTDPRVLAGLEARDAGALTDAAIGLKQRALLSSRGAFDVDLAFVSSDFVVPPAAFPDTVTWMERMQVLRSGFADSAVVVGPAADVPLGQAYEGSAPVITEEGYLGWVWARVGPEVLPQAASTPLLRTLLSSGYRDMYANLSLGSFHDGLLTESIGRSFRHYGLDAEVTAALRDTAAVWLEEVYGDRAYESYYQRRSDSHVVGVRAASVGVFDHLFYLLRLIVVGLCIGIPFYVGVLLLRRFARTPKTIHLRFRDRVLNALLILAIVAVIPVGIAGVGVVTEENTKAIQSWLRNHLQIVEVMLTSEAQEGEHAYRALERIGVDSLASRLGVDLNLYDREQLIASSKSRLVSERLTDVRLPIEAYQALFLDGYKSAFVRQQVGQFGYTAGVPCASGRNRQSAVRTVGSHTAGTGAN